eukprot:scaffold2357_cov167-Amphora_coffeaeformis.AAC.6
MPVSMVWHHGMEVQFMLPRASRATNTLVDTINAVQGPRANRKQSSSTTTVDTHTQNQTKECKVAYLLVVFVACLEVTTQCSSGTVFLHVRVAPVCLIQTCQKGTQTSNVFGQFPGPVRDIIVSPIGHPPRVALEFLGCRSVQVTAVTNIHFLVQPSVEYHDGTIHMFDSIDVGVNIQATQESVICVKEEDDEKQTTA